MPERTAPREGTRDAGTLRDTGVFTGKLAGFDGLGVKSCVLAVDETEGAGLAGAGAAASIW